MEILLGVIIFFFGTIIGSFLNVVIYRFNSSRTLGGRSMCMSCAKTLNWYELIPIVSFLVQDGRCRSCATRISQQYPFVEAITGLLFVFTALKFMWLLPENMLLFIIFVTYYMFFFSLLIVISVYDIKHKIIPDKLVWGAAIVAFVGQFFIMGSSIIVHLPTLTTLFSGIIIALPFAFIWHISKGKAMGLGDAKLMVAVGYLLGLSQGTTAVMLAFFIGALVSVFLLLLKRARFTMKSEIPFGPFLVLGACLVFLYAIDFPTFISFFSF